VFSGYFQNEKYFLHRKDEIIKLFEIDSKQRQYLQSKYDKLDNSIFLHIRLNDSINHPFHGIDYISYIKKALIYVFNMIPNIHIYIMTDDIENAIIDLKKISDGVFMLNENNYEIIKNENDINSLYLMSLCKLGGICSNSSFSWWGSYLNTNKDKIVIFPDKWMNLNWNVDIYYSGSQVMNITPNREMLRYNKKKINISDNVILRDNYKIDKELITNIKTYLTENNINSIVDLNCGMGDNLIELDNVLDSEGYDNNVHTDTFGIGKM
jgi:hypothetical protein